MSKGYHKDQDGFLSKSLATLKLGGLIYFAAKKGGPLFSNASQTALQSKTAFNIFNRASKSLRLGREFSPIQAAKELFSGESQVWYDTPATIRTGIHTTITRNKRLKKVIEPGLRDFLSGDVNEDAWSRMINSPQFKRTMGRFTEVENASHMPSAFRNKNIRKIRAMFREFGFEPLEGKTDSFMGEELKKIVNRNKGIQATASEIEGAFLENENHEKILGAITDSANEQARKASAFLKRFAPNAKTITWAEVEKNAEARRKVAESVQSTYKLPSVDDAEKFLLQRIEETKRGINDSFLGTGGVEFNKNESLLRTAENSIESFMQLGTGFVRMKNGQVRSMPQMTFIREQGAERLLNEISIPLIPFKFQIKAAALNFMPKSRGVVQNLRNLADNPELHRMSRLGYLGDSLKDDAQILSLSDNVIAIEQSEGKVNFRDLGQRVTVWDSRKGASAKRLSQARALDPDNYSLLDFSQDRGTLNKTEKAFFGNMQHFASLEYVSSPDRGGFVLRPHNRLYSGLVNKFTDNGFVDPEIVPPHMLQEFLSKVGPNVIADSDLSQALEHISREVSQANVNIAPKLAELYESIPGLSSMPMETDSEMQGVSQAVRSLILAGKDVKVDQNPELYVQRVFEILNQEIAPGMSLLSKGMSGTLKKTLNPDLYRAINMLGGYHPGINIPTVGEGGITHEVMAMIQGKVGVSDAIRRLQEGLSSEMLGWMGREKVAGALGQSFIDEQSQGVFGALFSTEGFFNTAERFLEESASADNPWLATKELLRQESRGLGALADLVEEAYGVKSKDSLSNLKSLVIKTSSDSTEELISTSALHSFYGGLIGPEELAGIKDPHLRAKVMGSFASNIESNRSILPNLKNYRMYEMLSAGESVDGKSWSERYLNDRFHALHPFHPQNEPYDLSFKNVHYATPNDSIDLASFISDPAEAIRASFGAGFNAGLFARSAIDTSRPQGSIGSLIHSLMLMPQHVAENIGIALPAADQASMLRTTAGFMLKRALPLYAAVETYKNINSDLHDMGLPGIDDAAANLVGNFNLASAAVKDMLGVTSLSKHFVYSIPGLDQWFTPRSREEYADHLFYGDEEVREGRGWITGTRDPILGGKVRYVRPSFFRRWKSHWTEADNVDISNTEYSWMPSLLHPFSPIKRALNPNWFVKKHLSDRPYAPGGIGTNNDLQNHNYLYGNSLEGGVSGGGIAELSIGAGFPSSLEAVGTEFNGSLQDPLGINSGFGGGGYGGGGYGGGRGGGRGGGGYGGSISNGDPYITALNYYVPNSAAGGSLSRVLDPLDNLRSQSGLFGSVFKLIPNFGVDNRLRRQNWKSVISNNRLLFGGDYGELSGSVGEFLRRIIHPDYMGANDLNNLPNNMPSWLPSRFRRGDPYTRATAGEMNLPGDAYERLNPWFSPLKIRGSAIGGSIDEIIAKWLNPDERMDEDGELYTGFGSLAHSIVQRNLRASGQLIGAEISVYDRENHISGTVDAVIRGMSGPEIMEIKTQGGEAFSKGIVPEKYIEQVNTYLAMTGYNRGYIGFVNRDNPNQVCFHTVNFDAQRYMNTLAKVSEARRIVSTMVDEGLISPFETYDVLARIDVLSKVAPESIEFRNLVGYANEAGGFGGFEKQLFEKALKRAKSLSDDYNLYPYRGLVKTSDVTARVMGVSSKGELLTDRGTLRLAGVNWDPQAFIVEDPATVLEQYGIHVGKKLKVRMGEGQVDEDIMNDVTLPVIVGGVNRALMKSIYASADYESKNPLDSLAVRGDGPGSVLLEKLIHMDTMIANKFMRVRSALEQFKRGEVYGTDDMTWRHLYGTLVQPTINSLIAGNPFMSALKAGTIATTLFESKTMKGKAARVVAPIVGALSTLRVSYELITGKKWIPKQARKRQDLDEYWDIMQYVKYSTAAEAAKKKAKRHDDVDIEELMSSEKRVKTKAGPWTTMAIQAERRAKNTMYGFDPATGGLQEALAAIPKRHKQLAESIITTGTKQEKRAFYDLLSNAEKRVLGKFLGVDVSSLPSQERLLDYFKTHFLPDATWKGWNENVDLEDLKARSEEAEGALIDPPSRSQLARAKALTRSIKIPNMHARTPDRIRSTLDRLVKTGGFSRVNVKYMAMPADSHVVNVNLNLFHDRTAELISESKNIAYDAH